jgi:NADH:ubiquinone oxidoreductase subunit
MRDLLVQIFTWWNGQTIGTRFHTWRRGEFVGDDENGNRYYRERGGRLDPALGIERRWVVFNGLAEASVIPPGWYGWMHHIVDTPPSEAEYRPHEWEKPHRANMTGTAEAYRPRGSALTADSRPRVTGDYDAWTPGS